jgi:hypothetical protein
MSVLVLEQYKSLFRNEESFNQFISLLEESGSRAETVPVWGKSRHLATLVSPSDAKTLVQERILRRIIENPGLLDEVRDRLENDPIVD